MRPAAAAVVALLLAAGVDAPTATGGESPNDEAPQPIVRLEVFPPTIDFRTLRARQQLVVTGFDTGGAARDLSGQAQLLSSNEGVARLQGTVAVPTGSGQAEIQVRAAGLEVSVRVIVTSHDRAPPVSLQNEVAAVLTRHGCNAGACHGSPSGKGGFRLSLRGFDAELDTMTLAREAFARRTNVLRPDASLLLRKPTLQIAHGGGLRLRTTDATYALLRSWIAEGCQADPLDTPQCVSLEVVPAARQLALASGTQQLAATAMFSDGTRRDVTHLADFTSTDETVATVDRDGLVKLLQRGETAILVRYLQEMAVVPITCLDNVPDFAWPAPPSNNYVDDHLFAKLRRLQIAPSDLCTDHEFVRRVYLDVLGMLPERAEAEAFVADPSLGKRAALIDRLLARTEHAEFWALKWGDLLRVKGSKLTSPGVHKFHRWLVTAIRTNVPYDQFVRELLTATGSTFEHPPAGYYRASPDPAACAETTAQLFLGLRIQCAKCHNHPYERITQDHYYGLAGFFARVQRKETNWPGEVIVWPADEGVVVHPRTGGAARLAIPLPGSQPAVTVPAGEDARQVLAAWLTRSDNPLLAKVAVNRIWGHLFGRGMVEPVDDFRESNPPSHGPLLDALAADFVAHGFDQRHILRTILNSRAYQLSSRTNRWNVDDNKYFSHAYARLLSAEQLLDAICQVTGASEKFPGLPRGTRATQLPSPDVGNDFLQVFGQPSRETACECERSDEPKLTQALQLISGELVASKLQSRQSRLSVALRDTATRLAAAGEPPRQGLVLWLRADAGAVTENELPAEDGQAVASWQDQSGGGRHVSQDATASRPRFILQGIADLPTLRFDGHDDLLHNTTHNLVESGSPRTVLLVGQAADNGPGGSIFTFRRSTQAATGRTTVFTAQKVALGEQFYVYSDGVNGAGNATLPSGTLNTVRKPFISVFLSRGAGQKLEVQLNGQVQPVSQPGAIGPDDGRWGFTVGSREDYPGHSWQGDMSEVLVYNRVLSGEELAAAGTYLATKYDLQTSYPQPKGAVVPHAGPTDEQMITDLYWRAFCRPPAADELQRLAEHVAAAESRRAGLEEVFWAVMNSKEFVFQH
jgi:hypothetical protein